MADTAIPTTRPTSRNQTAWLTLILLYLTIAVPILLTLASARVVMTPLFLQLEYHRPGFPDDVYGFTLDDRLTYAPFAVDYLINGEGIDYLGDLTFSDGQSLYNERELRHMEDVKVVTRTAFFVLFFGTIGTMIVIVLLMRSMTGRHVLRRGLFNGALLTLGIIATIITGAILAWDSFFTLFHQLFFQDGTWRFLYSDTLIRLFPEQFWFDAALTIGTMTTLGAIGIAILMWRWGVRADQTPISQ